MFIALPLMLIGVGFMIYLLFAAAASVLALYAGLAAGFVAFDAGASCPGAVLVGIAAAMLVLFVSHAAVQLTVSRGLRTAITLLFAVPTAIAGFQVASALLHLGGAGNWAIIFALAAAIATGVAAAKWYEILSRS